MDSIFSEPRANTVSAKEEKPATASKPGTPQAPKTVIRKSTSDIGTPSISQALNGKALREENEKKSPQKEKAQHATMQHEQPFTQEDLHRIWPELLARYKDQIHLYKTLEILPGLDGNMVIIEVENSVQQNKVKSIKPEIIGFLRRTLHNSQIDVQEVLNKSITERKVLTDEQKLKMMMQKNPALTLFKNKFNLDFS